MKKTLLLLIALAAFSFNTFAVMDPYGNEMVIHSEIQAVTYADGYYTTDKVRTNGPYVTDENGTKIPGAVEGALYYHGSSTTDYSPWNYFQCEWQRANQLLDVSIQTLIYSSGTTISGGTTFSDWDLGSNDYPNGLMFQTVNSISYCGTPMPQTVYLEQPTIIIEAQKSGFSQMKYDWLSTAGPGMYSYTHNSAHHKSACPAICAPVIPNTIFVVNRYQGATMSVRIPFTEHWTCNSLAVVYVSRPPHECVNYQLVN